MAPQKQMTINKNKPSSYKISDNEIWMAPIVTLKIVMAKKNWEQGDKIRSGRSVIYKRVTNGTEWTLTGATIQKPRKATR